MPRKIFLLTGKREVPFLEQFILARQPAIEVISATNRNEFQSIILNDLNDTNVCDHNIITDSIDIDPDKSMTIKYCEYCKQTFS